ncbi:hypothetical protein TNCV_2396771 [Trichonephila clavipes]|uniref:Uncharacterized protein n=1 Tax=Trichonephila clavipes TaxID=2585209 RepID=A0A8X6SR56_TRICX|nr:hypothetical protein TNCV_2396771 [Trichonephila clavipes]
MLGFPEYLASKANLHPISKNILVPGAQSGVEREQPYWWNECGKVEWLSGACRQSRSGGKEVTHSHFLYPITMHLLHTTLLTRKKFMTKHQKLVSFPAFSLPSNQTAPSQQPANQEAPSPQLSSATFMGTHLRFRQWTEVALRSFFLR